MNQEKICKSCGRVYKSDVDFLINTSCWRVCVLGNLYFNCSCQSTLMMPQGKYPWYTPERTMSLEARGIFNDFKEKNELPRFKSVFLEFQAELSSPHFDVKQIELILHKDPIFAAKIVEFANFRSGMGKQNSIKKIDHAISSLGHSCLYGLAMSLSVKDFVPPAKSFQKSRFWLEPMLASKIGTLICGQLGLAHPDVVFLGSSLANIGKLVGAFFCPDEFDGISSLLASKPMTWRQAERELNAKSHIVLGEIGLAYWGLPEFVRDAIRNHHLEPRGFHRHSDVVHCAAINLSMQLALLSLGEGHRVEESVLSAAMGVLQIPAGDRAFWTKKGTDCLEDTKSFLEKIN